MSDTDGFISEVNEEVRRDRLFALLRRYGWIGGLIVVLIVGGAAFSEYRKAQARAEAEALGDAILAAVSQETGTARADALAAVPAGNAGARAVAGMLAAAEAQNAGNTEAAVDRLNAIAANGDVAPIYRDIAAFKALILQKQTMPAAELRGELEALAAPGQPLSLLAREQIALLEIARGNTDAAISTYQEIISDAGVTTDLQQRALQVIVSLGGTPDLENLPGIGN
ncbi:hypothetical protein [Roseobacter sp.]|uniref:hypothetical protein n=1 Tax=Roseobacter sp. TaxID=1907202 RepID=UPI0025FFEA86|nr:hypothetical protein [Roseobacter sp.]